MNEIPYYLLPLLFIVAFLYASVGHGGASGYLALMALAGVASTYSRPVALVLNCTVSLIAFAQYSRRGYFDKQLFIWLALASIPMAYLGGSISLPELWYRKILGITLFIAALRLLWPVPVHAKEVPPQRLLLLLCGGAIGFVSGLIGIGGGVLLTPLLLFSGWTTIKHAASVSALFIFVNSLSGLFAQIKDGIQIGLALPLLAGITILGGFLGSWYGAAKWNSIWLRRVLALVLLIAAVKLIAI